MRNHHYWDLRVIQFNDPGEGAYAAVHEVHYFADGRLKGYSSVPAILMWSDDEPEAAKSYLEQLQRALVETWLTTRPRQAVKTASASR